MVEVNIQIDLGREKYRVIEKKIEPIEKHIEKILDDPRPGNENVYLLNDQPINAIDEIQKIHCTKHRKEKKILRDTKLLIETRR